jgi:hypothetical protein
MGDLCRVLIVGNLGRDIERRLQPDGTVVGVTTVCVGRTVLVNGIPQRETVSVPVEAIGSARAASLAQQFGAGSRVLIEGHLERRETVIVERCARADGAGDVLVQVSCSDLVLVVETIFNAAVPLPAPEAQRQPAQVAWEQSR